MKWEELTGVLAEKCLCWLLNSSTRIQCAEAAEMRYHAVQSIIHLESIAA